MNCHWNWLHLSSFVPFFSRSFYLFFIVFSCVILSAHSSPCIEHFCMHIHCLYFHHVIAKRLSTWNGIGDVFWLHINEIKKISKFTCVEAPFSHENKVRGNKLSIINVDVWACSGVHLQMKVSQANSTFLWAHIEISHMKHFSSPTHSIDGFCVCVCEINTKWE